MGIVQPTGRRLPTSRAAATCRSSTGVCSSQKDPRRRRHGWHIMRMKIYPIVSRYPVLAIVIAQGITERELAELLPSSITPPSSSTGSVKSHGNWRVRPPSRGTRHVTDIRSLCEEDFSHTELERVLLKRHKHKRPPVRTESHIKYSGTWIPPSTIFCWKRLTAFSQVLSF
ncbi:hypothetical protein MRX96_008946 [Rhipicephalus microplus]